MLSCLSQGPRGEATHNDPPLYSSPLDSDRKRQYTIHIYCRGGFVHRGYRSYFIKNHQTKRFSPNFGQKVDNAIDNFIGTLGTV